MPLDAHFTNGSLCSGRIKVTKRFVPGIDYISVNDNDDLPGFKSVIAYGSRPNLFKAKWKLEEWVCCLFKTIRMVVT